MQNIFKKVFKNIPVEITKDQLRDALRLALQSSIAAAITFLIMKSFHIPEMFLAILSAVLVVEPSIGDTFKQAKGRVYATLVGSAIGFIFVALIPWGFGTAVSLLITMFIMNGIAGLNPSWRYGVVAAVALSLGSENSAFATSLDRLIAIVIGITVGIIATSIIWPNRASKRANNHLRKALNACKERLEIAYENSKTNEKDDASDIADNFHTYLGRAKGAADAIRFGNKQVAFKQINATEKLYNSILILNRVGNNASEDLLDKEAGIKYDSEKLKNKACDVIVALVNKEEKSNDDLNELENLVNKVKNEVNTNSDNKEKNMFRHAFVFAITEIFESVQTLKQSLEDN